ncbi:MAG: hypothetical protein U9R26_03990 [Campylobacterota bacterium]|nr:hypothetical protein [Campylobacterota bacterium]
MNLFQKLFQKKKAPSKEEIPKERPDDWSLTVLDLMDELAEGKRDSVDSQERIWALDYERSLLPPDIRFPEKGDVYESLEDQSIPFLIAYSAPFTGGGEGVLLKGDRIWIHTDEVEDKPMGAYAIPVNYKELEQRMVASQERDSLRYDGFYFYFQTIDLNVKFRLIETDFSMIISS